MKNPPFRNTESFPLSVECNSFVGWRNANHEDIRKMLGLPDRAKLPTGRIPAILVQDWWIFVEAISTPHRRPARKRHRARALCTYCWQAMSAGRTHQHVCPWNRAGTAEDDWMGTPSR